MWRTHSRPNMSVTLRRGDNQPVIHSLGRTSRASCIRLFSIFLCWRKANFNRLLRVVHRKGSRRWITSGGNTQNCPGCPLPLHRRSCLSYWPARWGGRCVGMVFDGDIRIPLGHGDNCSAHSASLRRGLCAQPDATTALATLRGRLSARCQTRPRVCNYMGVILW